MGASEPEPAEGSGVTEIRGGVAAGPSSADGSFRFSDALASGPVQGNGW